MGVAGRAARVAGNRFEVEIGDKPVSLTNLDRVIYPETGFTKGDLIDYYVAVAPVLLPHLKDRAVTLRRFPDGVGEPGFWQKNCPPGRPSWMKTVSVESGADGDSVDYCLVDDQAGLAWLANAAGVEIHTSLASAGGRTVPDSVVFDLDPGEPAGIAECAQVALTIKGTLEELDLQSVVKTSGSKGMQVYIPLNSGASYPVTKKFAHMIARALESEMSSLVLSRMNRGLREGKVFVDWSQNSQHKTTVSVYSMRARSTPSVSVPLRWDEVEAAVDGKPGDTLRFGPEETLERVASMGDPFSELPSLRQTLPVA
ncbi:MAG: non-homologous end-joining DNA ligase [Solirubrobacterales bacterium]